MRLIESLDLNRLAHAANMSVAGLALLASACFGSAGDTPDTGGGRPADTGDTRRRPDIPDGGRTDADSSMARDLGRDTGEDEEIEHWKGKWWPSRPFPGAPDNRCAPEHEPRSKPQLTGATGPPPDEITAELAWKTNTYCPGLSGAGPDVGTVRDGTALGVRDGKPAVVTTLEVTLPMRPGNGTRAVAWLDADSGDSLHCEPVNLERRDLGGPMILDPSRSDAPYFASETRPDDHFGVMDYERHLGWWSTGWDPPERGLAHDERTAPPSMRLLPDGELLIFWKNEWFILSIDSHTGEFNWIVGPGDFPAEFDDERYVRFDPATVRWRQDEDDFVVQMYSQEDLDLEELPKFQVAINRCGDIRTIDRETYHRAQRIPFGDGYLIPGRHYLSGRWSATAYRADGTPIGTVDDCRNIVSVTDTRIACAQRGGAHPADLRVATLTSDGEEDVWTLPGPSRPGFDSFANHLVALSGGVLLARAVLNQTSGNIYRLYFLDATDGTVLETLDFVDPPDRTSGGIGGPELVSDNGVIVLDIPGYLFGVQTNFSGLSPTRFPRGLVPGRNRNLGVY